MLSYSNPNFWHAVVYQNRICNGAVRHYISHVIGMLGKNMNPLHVDTDDGHCQVVNLINLLMSLITAERLMTSKY
jgi:hypothetical protein